MSRKGWKDLRETRLSTLGNLVNWKNLEQREKKKIEAEEKELRKEVIRRKKMKFGKAGKWKLSWLKETLLTNQTRKRMELQEAKKNIQENFKNNIPEGRKEPRAASKNLPEGWKAKEVNNEGKDTRKDSVLKLSKRRLETSIKAIEENDT